MNQPIEIRKNIVDGQEVQTVNARELHAFLEVGTRFDTWLERRVSEYGFVQGIDFTRSFLSVEQGGTGRHEYHISIDMAKELSMVERNDKGKQARQYFIECERRAKAAMPAVPQTLPEALRLAADLAEQVTEQAAQLQLARPAVVFVDKYVDSTGLKSFREACKILQANESRFREFLADRKVMYRLNGAWVPYQCHIDAGRLSVKTGVSERNGYAFTDVKFTPKGVNWIAGEWGKYQIQGEVA